MRVFSCKVGECPWDDWYLAARAAGIDTELALLGSAVMREADRRGWSEELQAECGWGDDGAAMLAFALREPERARLRWQHLLEHDVAASVK